MHYTVYTLLTLFTIALTTFAETSSIYPTATFVAPPTLATNELRIEECFVNLLSNRQFSRTAAYSMISSVCEDLIAHSVVMGPDQRGLPSGPPFDADSRKQGSTIANASAVLFVHPNFMEDACPGPALPSTGQPALLTTDFGKTSMEDCMAPFLMALDGCGDYVNKFGADFWKWGGYVNKNCISYTVDANIDTQLAPGPGY